MPGRSEDLFVVPRAGPRRARVLLVDGDSPRRHELAAALVEQGLSVDEARGASDALAIVTYARPDVVVYGLGWGATLRALDQLTARAADRGPRPAVVLLTPAWVQARRGVTLRGAVPTEAILAAVRRALVHARARR